MTLYCYSLIKSRKVLKDCFCRNRRIIGNKRAFVFNEFSNFKMISTEPIDDAHDGFNFIMVKMKNLGIKTERDKSQVFKESFRKPENG